MGRGDKRGRGWSSRAGEKGQGSGRAGGPTKVAERRKGHGGPPGIPQQSPSPTSLVRSCPLGPVPAASGSGDLVRGGGAPRDADADPGPAPARLCPARPSPVWLGLLPAPGFPGLRDEGRDNHSGTQKPQGPSLQKQMIGSQRGPVPPPAGLHWQPPKGRFSPATARRPRYKTSIGPAPWGGWTEERGKAGAGGGPSGCWAGPGEGLCADRPDRRMRRKAGARGGPSW
ncbi:uncharacterized protein LOC110195511 [Phascolarctos cinereus]